MPDLHLHGIGATKKPRPMSLEFLLHPKHSNQYDLLGVNKKYVVHSVSGSSCYVLRRRDNAFISDFKPFSSTWYMPLGKQVFLGDCIIGKAYNDVGQLHKYYWQNVLNPATQYGEITLSTTNEIMTWYYSDDGQFVYILTTDYKLIKLTLNSSGVPTKVWETALSQSAVVIYGEYNGKLYIGSQYGRYTVVDVNTAAYWSVIVAETSADAVGGGVYNGKLIWMGTGGVAQSRQIAANGYDSTLIKSLTGLAGNVIVNSKGEVFIGVSGSDYYIAWTNKYDTSLNLVETSYSQVAIYNSTAYHQISRDEIFTESVKLYNYGTGYSGGFAIKR